MSWPLYSWLYFGTKPHISEMKNTARHCSSWCSSWPPSIAPRQSFSCLSWPSLEQFISILIWLEKDSVAFCHLWSPWLRVSAEIRIVIMSLSLTKQILELLLNMKWQRLLQNQGSQDWNLISNFSLVKFYISDFLLMYSSS